VFCHVRAELEQAEEYSEAMRQLGDAQGDPMWKCFASAYSADTCSYLGKFEETRSYSEKALSLWNASYRAFVPIAGDPYVVCQRQNKNASAGRSKNTSVLLAGRPPKLGSFVRASGLGRIIYRRIRASTV
jgi:hypothetical protein